MTRSTSPSSSTEPESLETDFGRLETVRPAEIARPTSGEEVSELFARARRDGQHVALRGVGHCAGGQSLVDGGLCIDVRSMNRILDIDADEATVDVEGGCTWSALMDALLALGWTVPVVTDWLHLTVAGTLSLGGVGSQSFRRGLQADHVLELELLTFDGRPLRLERNRDREQLDLVLGGVGQLGMITRCKLRLERAPTEVTVLHCFYSNLDDFRDAVASRSRSPGVRGLIAHARSADPVHFFARHPANDIRNLAPLHTTVERDSTADVRSPGGWVYDLEVILHSAVGAQSPLLEQLASDADLGFRHLTMSYADFIRRVPPILEGGDRAAVRHPELALVLSEPDASTFLREQMNRLQPETIGFGTILLVPLDGRTIDTPAFPSPPHRGWLFAVLSIAPLDDDVTTERMLSDHAQAYDRARACGGRHYPCDSNRWGRGEEFWRRHFGEIWSSLKAAKRRADPLHQLNPGAGIFA